jgi:hypothetical protein
LVSVAALVFLINATYQDGSGERRLPAVLRFSPLVAAIAIVPLVAIAGYGLFLRVQQYAWTPQRIVALACIAVAACYALGYLIAAARSPVALKGLEGTNILTAFVIVAVLLALHSPLADPSRIAVAAQVARLQDGGIDPQKFDYNFLRFYSGRYGKAELERLAALADNAPVAEKAKEALRRTTTYTSPPRPTPQALAAQISVVHPSGQALPESFVRSLDQPATQIALTMCRNTKCDAILLDLDDDGKAEILFFNPYNTGSVFKEGADGWVSIGQLTNGHCPGIRDALKNGQFETVQPLFKDIDVNGQRLRVSGTCLPPKTPPAAVVPAR